MEEYPDPRKYDLGLSCLAATRHERYDIALLPWGATEPHNLHLPYLTDCLLSHDIACSAAREAWGLYGVHAMVMPPVAMGSQNPGQRQQPFCVHTRTATQKAILRDIADSLYAQGLRRLLIINGHGGNSFKGFIRDLAVDLPDMLVGQSEWFKVCPPGEFFDHPGDHADELETSVMMHYHPELVRLDEAGPGAPARRFGPEGLRAGVAWVPRDWSQISRDTGVGDPRGATADKGARYARAVAERYALLLRDLVQGPLYTPPA